MMKCLVYGCSLVLGLTAVCSAAEPLAAGDHAPEIVVETWLNTVEPVSLARTNTIFVVEFWATWCGPCKISIPHLNRLHDRVKGRDVTIVGLTDEDEKTVRAFMTDLPIQYALGTGSSSADAYGVSGIPMAFVVRNKKVLWSGHPLQSLDMAVDRALGDPFEPENAAAVVGSAIIDLPTFRAFVTAAMGDANLEAAPEVSKYRLLDLMIQRTQLMALLETGNLSVSEEDIELRYATEKAEYENMPENKGKTFEAFLKENGVSRFLRHEMLRIDLATERLAELDFDEADVKAAYDENPAQYHRAHVHHIMLKVENWSDADAVKATRARLESIREEIVAGKDFGELAKLHSAGGRASHGGDWGWMGKGGQTSIDSAMFELPVGSLSDVLLTPVGVHLIKVIARKDTFESLKADLRQELLHERKLDILRKTAEDETIRRNPYL